MSFFRLYIEWAAGFAILFVLMACINSGVFIGFPQGIGVKKDMSAVDFCSQAGYVCDISQNAEIYYNPKNTEYKDMILRMVETYYPLIINDFKYKPAQKAKIILYSSKSEMAKSLKMTVKNVPMGAYYKGVLSILSPELWVESDSDVVIREKFMEDGPVVHELVHLVLDNVMEGKYPLWFTEGVALYYEYKYLNFQWRSDLSQSAQKITLEMLEKDFKSIDNGPSYRKSFEIIKYIVDTYSEAGLQRLISEMKNNADFQSSYQKVFNSKPIW